MSSFGKTNPVTRDECEACGQPYVPSTLDGYSIWHGRGREDAATAEYHLCHTCAIKLVVEIANALDDDYFDVLTEALDRTAAADRRRAREPVIS